MVMDAGVTGEETEITISRACLQSLNPEKNRSDGDHSEIVGGTLFISCGDASKALQPVDQALDDVALAVCLAVEVGLAALVGFGRDHRRDAALAQSEPDAPAAVGLVTSQLGRPQARPSPADAPDCAAIDQGGDLLAVMHLAAGQGERDRLAVALAAHMDLGREAAARAAERLIPGAGFTTRLARPGAPPPAPGSPPALRPPAAGWGARTTVLSSKCSSQQTRSSASARACNSSSTRCHTPDRRQR